MFNPCTFPSDTVVVANSRYKHEQLSTICKAFQSFTCFDGSALSFDRCKSEWTTLKFAMQSSKNEWEKSQAGVSNVAANCKRMRMADVGRWLLNSVRTSVRTELFPKMATLCACAMTIPVSVCHYDVAAYYKYKVCHVFINYYTTFMQLTVYY